MALSSRARLAGTAFAAIVGLTAVSAISAPAAVTPAAHVAVNGETIYLPAGVSVSLVGGTPAPSAAASPSSTPAPTTRPTLTPIPVPTPGLPSAAPSKTPARTLTCTAGRACYTPKAGEIIDGWTITGPGDGTYDGSTVGLLINQPGVIVRNTTISGFGDACIRIDGAAGFLIENDVLSDCAYAGIIGTGARTGTVRANLVQRIGARGHQRDANAYGIVFSMWAGGTPSSDVLVDGNTVTDVPLWHAYDCHGCQRVTFSNDISRRAARAFFITANLATERSTDVVLTGNLAAEPKSNTAAGGTDSNSAFTLYDTRGTQVIANRVSGYGTILNDTGGLSQGTVQSGNVRVAA